MKIYHGTSAKALDSILRAGIKPRKKAKSNWQEYPSHPEMVYLTTTYPLYFASCVADDGVMSIVEIELDLLNDRNLYPDEDFLAQAFSMQERVKIKDIHEDIKARLDLNQNLWRISLDKMGVCAHKGVVPANAIMGWATVDGNKRPNLFSRFLDPSISILNYKIMSEYYKAFVRWVFGDQRELPPDHYNHEDVVKDASHSMRELLEKRKKFYQEESANRQGIEVNRIFNR